MGKHGIKFEHGDGDDQQKEKDDFKDGDGVAEAQDFEDGTLIDEVVSDNPSDTLTIDSIPGVWKSIRIEASLRSQKTGVNADIIYVYLNNDITNSNYRNNIYYNVTAYTYRDLPFLGTIPAANSLTNDFAYYEVSIMDYADNTINHCLSLKGNERRSVTEHYIWWGSIFWESNAAITKIRIVCDGANFVSGSKFRIFGMR